MNRDEILAGLSLLERFDQSKIIDCILIIVSKYSKHSWFQCGSL